MPPNFVTRTPEILNSGNMLSFSLPVINSGTESAANIVLTGASLGSAALIYPALPLPMGDLAVDNATTLYASFSSAGLAVGRNYLANMRGTYDFGGATYGFTMNRFLTVPGSIPPPIALLAAHVRVTVDAGAGTWSYIVFNDEPLGSPRYINAISIDMAAPFTVIQTPPGWSVDTDNSSYVLWYAADLQLPYPNQIAPGGSLGGFQIQSERTSSEGRAFIITSWNHQTDQADLTTPGSILTPSRT